MAYFLGDTKPPAATRGGVGGPPGGLRGKELGHVRLGARPPSDVVEPGGLPAHQARRLDRHVGSGERELDALVGADRPAEDDPLAGVGGSAIDEETAVADALGGDQ